MPYTKLSSSAITTNTHRPLLGPYCLIKPAEKLENVVENAIVSEIESVIENTLLPKDLGKALAFYRNRYKQEVLKKN